MNKKQALKEFKELYPKKNYYHFGFPYSGKFDNIARRLNWPYFCDMLCKEGRITMKQYETWCNPF